MTETTDLAVRNTEPTGALALRGDQTDWTPVQRAALSHLGIEDAPTGDQQVFLHVAQRSGLDPFARQIYMIPRKQTGKNGQPDVIKWTIQTAIDGFRLIAEKHPQYAGTLDPEWCGDDGQWRETWTDRKPPTMARVKVLRHDRAHPISLPIRFTEFAATFSDGNLQGQWRTKPAHMIAKCAEAAALRKAFPQDLSGLITDDEAARDDLGRNEAPSQRPGVVEGVTVDELTGIPTAEAAPRSAEHAATASSPKASLMAQIVDAGRERGWTTDALTADFKTRAGGTDPANAPHAELRAYLDWLLKQAPRDQATTKPSKQMFAKLHAQLADLNVVEAERHETLSMLVGRTITSANELSKDEVQKLVNQLENVLADENPAAAMDGLLAAAEENAGSDGTA